ncbi:MAG: OsmC family protein [Gammaproteobacteria bacterium]|nr:OsmC family protein [Gammaproteobacteria bacterium]
MRDLPHHYAVSASGDATSHVILSSEGLENLDTAGPAEFGGPGDVWSPETLLVGSVANCFVLSFRAIARASRFEWVSLSCDVSGTLDKVERVTQFTRFDLRAELTIAPGTDEKKAHRLLEKAESHCLITSSLKAESHLEAEVRFSD